ncbi:stimulator of interferon genes protein isoform X2 [Boleophthalmus pectinirostris]|nr:stimulator of interferon genes protein isoform X2 [Boleophthalmus pectinirostris]
MQSLRSQSELVPDPRGSLPKLCALGVAVVSVVVVAMLMPEMVVSWVSMATLLLSLCPLVHGIFLFVEEVVNQNNRYRGRSVLVRLCNCGLVRPLLSVVLSGLVLNLSGSPLPLSHLCVLLWLCSVLYAALRSLGVLVASEVELSDICETRRMNVAHGLAWSFYLGYLQLVLPRLEDAISAFCASHQSTAHLWSRGSKRLFILIPINANISHKLEDEDERVQFCESLPNSQLDRGGVRGRVYKHSVYKVYNHKGQAHYCVLEYATPLLTLHSMSQDSSAAFGEPQRREQVLLFFRTLTDILQRSLECRNRYTLVLLNDEHKGDPHYLSKCILGHLQQQNTEEYAILPHPQPEQTPPTIPGQQRGAWGGHQGHEGLMSDPSLMFSVDSPRTLRGPVETTDYSKSRHNGHS